MIVRFFLFPRCAVLHYQSHLGLQWFSSPAPFRPVPLGTLRPPYHRFRRPERQIRQFIAAEPSGLVCIVCRLEFSR
jgi:hypothetical protein